MAYNGGPYDLSVQPQSRGLPLHPSLERSDGFSFLIIHRAGTTMYSMEVEDPFFEAHSNCSSIESGGQYPQLWPKELQVYCPDHEATALGCLEQYQS